MSEQIWTILQDGDEDAIVWPGLYKSEAECVQAIREEIFLMYGVDDEEELKAVGALDINKDLRIVSQGIALRWSQESYNKEYVDTCTDTNWTLTRHK